MPPLASRCTGAPRQRHPGDTETDSVVRGVAKEIERVGLQCGRTGSDTRNDLRHEEAGVDNERDPERPIHFGLLSAVEVAAEEQADRDSRPCKCLGGL